MLLGIWKENMLEGPQALDEACMHFKPALSTVLISCLPLVPLGGEEVKGKEKEHQPPQPVEQERKQPHTNMHIALTMGRLALEVTNDPPAVLYVFAAISQWQLTHSCNTAQSRQ